MNWSTVTAISCARDRPGLRGPPSRRPVKSASRYHGPQPVPQPGAGSDPFGNAARATSAVCSGTSGHLPGLRPGITTSILRQAKGKKGKAPRPHPEA